MCGVCSACGLIRRNVCSLCMRTSLLVLVRSARRVVVVAVVVVVDDECLY